MTGPRPDAGHAVAPKPKAPPRLAAAGRALWKRIIADFELDVYDLILLECAARQADDVASLEALLAEQGLVVEGSQGQPRLSAVVTELRQSRLAFSRLLAEVGLPNDDQEAGASPASRRAQKAADSRWGQHRSVAERRGRLTAVDHGA